MPLALFLLIQLIILMVVDVRFSVTVVYSVTPLSAY